MLNRQHSGTEFEQHIHELLLQEQYEVIPNVLIGYFERKMEIDLLGIKDGTITIVSCRDATSVNCLMSLRLDIKQKAHRIEQRKFLLNADYARLYLKVTKEVYEKVKQFEGIWIKSVEIIFIVE